MVIGAEPMGEHEAQGCLGGLDGLHRRRCPGRGGRQGQARVGIVEGRFHRGPMEAPGGDWVMVASNPHGVMFGAVGSGK